MPKLKRLTRSVRLYHFMNAVVMGALFTLLLMAIVIGTKQYHQMLMAWMISAIFFVCCVVLEMIRSITQCICIKNRLKEFKPNASIEEDGYTACTKELSYGSDWLVYHHDNTYLFWTKESIRHFDIAKEGKIGLTTLAIFSDPHPEGEAIHVHKFDQDKYEALCHWLQVA